jgi:peptidyl-dipeptidase A
VSAIVLGHGCSSVNQHEQHLSQFIARHVQLVDPLNRQANLAFWAATTTGRQDEYQRMERLQLAIKRIYSDPNDFAYLKSLKTSGTIRQPRLRRQLDRLYLAYLPNQVQPELLAKMTQLDTKIQKAYNDYRPSIDGKVVTINNIYTILTTEPDSELRKKAWQASRQVGNVIVEDLLNLVRLRNRSAKILGFDNYHQMALVVAEQDPDELDRLFDELEALTREPFLRMNAVLDRLLASKYGLPADQLMPWHYHDPFFQRSPLVYDLDLDAYYKGKDIKQIAEKYYASIGLPVDQILAASDLYDKPGKDPHAYGMDVDRHGDARVLANLQDTERWMETLLHEVGHAVYSKYHDMNEPWLLREPAHSFTTEAIAMFFGRLSRNPLWMQHMLGLSDQEVVRLQPVTDRYMRFQQVLFIRWALVMYHFEKQLYANPDQDLNRLWWDLVERYQFLKRPPGEPDAGWASKLHFVKAPCYYHNYVLGELLASQLEHHIKTKILSVAANTKVSYANDARIGRYLRRYVFGPGARYHWQDMIRLATGEELTPRYFVEQFVH